jgi:hypothetical protein
MQAARVKDTTLLAKKFAAALPVAQPGPSVREERTAAGQKAPAQWMGVTADRPQRSAEPASGGRGRSPKEMSERSADPDLSGLNVGRRLRPPLAGFATWGSAIDLTADDRRSKSSLCVLNLR